MRKISILLAVLFLSILLAGCISIPLGDGGKLEVSKDGVSIAEGEDVAVEGEEDGVESDGEVEAEDGAEGTDDEESITDGGETNEGESVEVVTGSSSCAEPIEDTRGNDRALKQLAELATPNFPFPDCTKIGTVSDSYYEPYEAKFLDANFTVEGYWADIFDLYKGYLEESRFGPLKKHENAKSMSATLKGNSADYDLTLDFRQVSRDDGIESVEVRLILYHYDTPRDEK